MRAILLCAGFATRMYPLTENFPKPLLEVAGKPVLDYLMDQMVDLPGLEEILVVTNARFISHFEQWRDTWQPRMASNNISVQIFNDGSTTNDDRLGAVADLEFVLDKLEMRSPTLVGAADNIFRFPILPIWKKFAKESKNYIVALSETNLEKLRRTGVLEFGEDGLVNKLHEKPKFPFSNWACPPLYFFQPIALNLVTTYVNTQGIEDSPGHFVSYLVQREKVFAEKVTGNRYDIGSFDSYKIACHALTKEKK